MLIHIIFHNSYFSLEIAACSRLPTRQAIHRHMLSVKLPFLYTTPPHCPILPREHPLEAVQLCGVLALRPPLAELQLGPAAAQGAAHKLSVSREQTPVVVRRAAVEQKTAASLKQGEIPQRAPQSNRNQLPV